MQSITCPECSLVNFSTAQSYKRCGYSFISASSNKLADLVRTETIEKFSENKLSRICPRCGSSDTQSFQMAYKIGTSLGNGSVTTYNEEFGVSVSSVSTRNQTILANQVKPPIEPNLFGNYAVIFILDGIIMFIGIYLAAIGVPYFLSWAINPIVLAILQFCLILSTFVLIGFSSYKYIGESSKHHKIEQIKFKSNYSK